MDIFGILENAIASKTALSIKYNGGSRPGTIRIIIPTKISGDRVFAFCEESGSNKSFMLAKIELPTSEVPNYSEHKPLSDEEALHEVYQLYKAQWTTKGWHIDHGKDYISLFRRFKNGNLRKYPTVDIRYDSNNFFGEEIWPWYITGVGSYKNYNKAINRFLELSLSVSAEPGR